MAVQGPGHVGSGLTHYGGDWELSWNQVWVLSGDGKGLEGLWEGRLTDRSSGL